MVKRIAIIDRDKCHPQECGNYLCAKLCPVNRSGADCIYPAEDMGKKARIDEMLCTGCGICPNRCPFGAIQIINLPDVLSKSPVHRFGENMFELYSLPTPIFGQVIGILGKNGLGKSTAFKLLANIIKPNLGKWDNPPEFKEVLQYFKGTEMQRFLDKLQKNEVTLSYKPQQVDLIPVQYKGTVQDLLTKLGNGQEVQSIVEKLHLINFLDTDVGKISGGELQRVAIAAAVLKKANLYLFDEPTSYLDIRQRLLVSEFIRSLVSPEKAIVVIEHDLIILDYIADLLNIMYGQEGAYGVVSGVKATREGINAFLEGYLKEENVRFRDHALKFGKTQEQRYFNKNELVSWNDLQLTLGHFSLSSGTGALRKNEVVGVLGENGIGKTTFVKILAGVTKPTQGSIDGDVRVSYKPQYVGTDSEMLVGEFLQHAVDRYQHQLITPLDVEKLFTLRLRDLSGGQLQRVMIAHCLAEEAQLYLLDEPAAYLDVEQRVLISKIIKSITQERDVTIVVVDHDLMFLDYVSDRLMVFSGEPGKHGRVEGPFGMEEGMNRFLKELGITLRRDIHSQRPRINKPGSVKDREQREANAWYYG